MSCDGRHYNRKCSALLQAVGTSHGRWGILPKFNKHPQLPANQALQYLRMTSLPQYYDIRTKPHSIFPGFSGTEARWRWSPLKRTQISRMGYDGRCHMAQSISSKRTRSGPLPWPPVFWCLFHRTRSPLKCLRFALLGSSDDQNLNVLAVVSLGSPQLAILRMGLPSSRIRGSGTRQEGWLQ